MRVVPFLLACMIASPAVADSDPWGNVYPPECADLSDVRLEDVRIVEVRHLPVAPGTESRCGVWLDRPEGHVIYLLKSCPYSRAEVLRHELCHEKVWGLTGDPRWHGH